MPRIPRAIIDEMIAHSREDLPNEAGGMVHAKDGVPIAVHRVKNVALQHADGTASGSPWRYAMDSRELLRLDRLRDPAGETLFAIYHSHVASKAVPSNTDVRMALAEPMKDQEPRTYMPWYPETFYILVSLGRKENDVVIPEEPPVVRAWRIGGAGSIEEAIERMQEEPIEVA